MKFYYPKYLKSSPQFIGLSIIDLFILVGGLLISLIFSFGTLATLSLIVTIVGGFKVLSLKFPRGYFSLYFLKRRTLFWREDYLKLVNGLLI
jgi:hypothetical protein